MNNKGFTLIELLAIILLLAIVSTIGTYAVSSYIESARIKSDEILWENIKTASKEYADECTSGVSSLTCGDITSNPFIIETTIKQLAELGFLNTTTDNSNSVIVIDSNKNDIGDCPIEIRRQVDSNYNVSYTFILENSNDSCKSLISIKNKKGE